MKECCANCYYSRITPYYLSCYAQKNAPRVLDTDSCESWKSKSATRADKIRTMTDEQLAEAFMAAEKYGLIHNGGRTKEWWMEWLKGVQDAKLD